MSVGHTFIQSQNEIARKRPLVVLIPGGPGLSSKTLRSLDVLRRSFDLVYIDPPGTAGNAPHKTPTFSSVAEALEQKLRTWQRDLILLGHSYGGLFAAELALRGNLRIEGLVLLSTPLTTRTYIAAVGVFQHERTPELDAAEKVYETDGSDESFRAWLASYGKLYFHPSNGQKGRDLILGDAVSNDLFVELSKERVPATRSFADSLKVFSVRKLLIGGSADLMFPPKALRSDAIEANADFKEISGASHFVMFDQPEAAVREIESWCFGSVLPKE